MNASSSEASLGVSSYSTTDADAASSPIRGAGRPVTIMLAAPRPHPGWRPRGRAPVVDDFVAWSRGRWPRGRRLRRPPAAMTPPAAVISSASRSGSGVRTSTDRSELRWMNSCVVELGDQAAPADDDEVVGGDRHLAHQVAGDEDRAAFGGELPHEGADPADALRVQAVDRLVQQQHLGIAEHRRRDAEPLGHAEREAARSLAGHGGQADQVQDLVDPARRETLRLGEEQQVVAGTAAGMQGPCLKQRADRGAAAAPAADRPGRRSSPFRCRAGPGPR